MTTTAWPRHRRSMGRRAAVAAGGAVATMLATGGLVSAIAQALVDPPALEVAEPLAAMAPWLSVAVAVGVGSLLSPLRWRVLDRRPGTASRRRDALALGVAPIAAGVGAWFCLVAGAPLLSTQSAGVREIVPATVTAKLDESRRGCDLRLVVASASLPGPLAVCVDPSTWARADEGGTVTIEVVRSALATEVRRVR